ncbi:MAG: hypothetical protein ACOX5Y_00190 [Acholeplasmataceae bacterium]|jgi:hypothetical protein
MKETIKGTYYLNLAGHLFLFFCGIGFAIFIFINRVEFININIFGKIGGIIFVIFILIGLIILIILSLKEVIKLMKDYKSIKANKYITIIGKVIKFRRNRDPETGLQMNNRPIVLVKDTNEKIELFTHSILRVGHSYIFNYLKNSKIAEAVEECIE